MKQMLTTVLVASIVWTPRMFAQTAGSDPLSRSAALEAVRPAPRSQSSPDDRWRDVTNLRSGLKITLVAGNVTYANRYAIAADVDGVTVLNPAVSGRAGSLLVRLATDDPGYFADGTARSEIVNGLVSAGPAGVFVDGRKVADIAQVVERFNRQEIREIRTVRGNKGTFLGDFGGFFVIGGAVAGTIWGVNYGHDQFKSHKGVGGLLGGIGGYVIGLVAGQGTVSLIDKLDGSNVVYRIP